MTASTDVCDDSTPFFSEARDAGPAKSGVSFYQRRRQPVWSRRKEIIYGTDAKINPARTIARRASLICRKAGAAAAYYFWLVERIGSGDSTKFKIPEAAEALGVNRRAIERYNTALVKLGFIAVRNRKHRGYTTYSEYVLLPINDIIGDHGHATTKVSQRRYDKSVATKRAINKTRVDENVLPASPHPLQAAEQAEAGRAGASPAAASAGFATKGDERDEETTHKKNVQRWLAENEPLISKLGFKAQNPSSLTKDVLAYTHGDEERWTNFQEQVWPVLIEKARASDFLKRRNRSCGFGWLFQKSKISEKDELNLEVFVQTRTYSNLDTPDVSTLFSPGDRVLVYGKTHPVIVIGFVPGSLMNYEVYAEILTTPEEIEANTYTAHFKEMSLSPKDVQ